jgi:hypothetical protein
MPRLRSVCLFLVFPALASCQHYDKAAHFAAGAAVSHIVATETDNKAAGCAAAFGIGLLKEMVDDVSDPLDLIATGIGCSVTLTF